MKGSATLLVAAVGLLSASLLSGSVFAAEKNPSGTFGGVGELGCLFAPSGFNASNQPTDPSSAFSNNGSVVAVYTFKKNGTGTLLTRTVTNTQSQNPSASSSTAQANFTYTVAKSGEITITSTGTPGVTGSIDSGPRSGQTFAIDTLTLNAFIAQGNKAIAVATTNPNVETITYSNLDSFPRICHREVTLMPIPPVKNMGD